MKKGHLTEDHSDIINKGLKETAFQNGLHFNGNVNFWVVGICELHFEDYRMISQRTLPAKRKTARALPRSKSRNCANLDKRGQEFVNKG